MRYERREAGFALWSVGWDGIDEGGAAWDRKKKTGDWTWRR
jgi:hypothetical protein